MEEINSKEVNLLQLITLFFNWLKKIGETIFNFIGYLAQLSFRHKIIVIASVLVCMSYGLYKSRPTARIYKAEGLVMLYGTEAQTVKEVCKQLENSISSNNLFSLSTKLSIPDSVAKNIVGFNSFYVIDYLKDKVADIVDYDNKNSLTDTLNIRMKDRLYFQIKTININQLPIIQTAVLNYFNNNSVMKAQFISTKNDLEKEIQICDDEIQLIDSLAKVSYFKDVDKQIKFENNKLLVGEQKKQLFYEELLGLQSVRAKSLSKIVDFKNPIDMPSGFVLNANPLNSSGKYGLISIFVGYLISLIISILIENMKKIITFLDKK